MRFKVSVLSIIILAVVASAAVLRAQPPEGQKRPALHVLGNRCPSRQSGAVRRGRQETSNSLSKRTTSPTPGRPLARTMITTTSAFQLITTP